MVHQVDYSELTDTDIKRVEHAMSTGDGKQLSGYIPEKKLGFVLRNYMQLAELGILEPNWMMAYTHASNFGGVSLSLLQEIFDACDKNILQQDYPLPPLTRLDGHRFSLFRGCAGPEHRMGMSWVPSLDKAIWYAAHHAALRNLTKLAVYAATVDRAEIYCRGDHYDYDYIVRPKTWWRVDVPDAEFKVDRLR
jgi:hypothetical protein